METQKCSTSASMASQPHSPSFNSCHSSENLADIAARVVSELNLSHNDPYDDDFYSSLTLNDSLPDQNDAAEEAKDDDDDDDDESEFEFAVLCGGESSSPISADEMFSNGQIRPMYPIFNTALVYGYQNDVAGSNQNPDPDPDPKGTIRIPLRRLLTEEKENASCSSSEADDLDRIAPGTYCVWAPKKKVEEEKMIMGKKSKSTGSSKRWKFRDLLYRSNSDGKETFVFLTPYSGNHRQNSGEQKRREKAVAAAKNKKSYLPYRQDLVGFFANVNGVSRSIRPF